MSEKGNCTSILIIGNEILSGRTQDVNISHVAETLGDWGIVVDEHCRVIPDVEQIIVDHGEDEVRSEYDYVFTTRWNWSTHDDITAECIAPKAFRWGLEQNEEIASRIKKRPAPDDVMEVETSRGEKFRSGSKLNRQSDRRTTRAFPWRTLFVMAGIPSVMQAMLSSLDGKQKAGKVVRSHSVRSSISEKSPNR